MAITRLGNNRFRVTFPARATVPKVQFKGLPVGMRAVLSEQTLAGFVVRFEPETIPVAKFDYFLDEDLLR
jgi:hypothetical protein